MRCDNRIDDEQISALDERKMYSRCIEVSADFSSPVGGPYTFNESIDDKTRQKKTIQNNTMLHFTLSSMSGRRVTLFR